MAAESVAKSLVVEVAGSPLPPDLANSLVEGYVDDSRTLPDLFVLRFRDPSHMLLDKAGIRIGTEVRLLAQAGGQGGPKPLLVGEVTALELEVDGSGTFTVVRGLDKSHRLFRGRRVVGYQNMTVADICTRVATRAGLAAGIIDVPGPVLEHAAQGNVTDWEFLSALANEAGAEAYVVDGKLNVTRPTAPDKAPDAAVRANQNPLVLELGDNLVRCRASVSAAEQVTSVEVRGWDAKAQQPLVGRAEAGKAATLDLGVSAAEVAQPFGTADYVVTDTVYAEQAQVDQAAKALAERITGSFAELEAVVRGNPEIRAGGAVTLAGVGKPWEGRYTVTSSRHVFDPVRGYETWISVSGRQERSIFGLAGGGGGGARSAPPDRVPGLVVGLVTDTQDPAGLSRVKVQFPWLSADYASNWARTAQSAGGEAAMFHPEVGDEVLVGFEQGHLERPYVLGALKNGKNGGGSAAGAPRAAGTAAPAGGAPGGDRAGAADPAAGGPPGGTAVDGTSGAVNRRSFGSPSGNRIDLLDAANGPQGVSLLTGDGKLKIDLDRKGTTITVHSDGAVEIKAQRQVTIDAGDGLKLDAGQGAVELVGSSVKLTATSGLELNGGNGRLAMTTSGALEVQGAQLALKGTDRTAISGGATCTINARLVKIN
ncbi:VgrG-related protein [Streptomycetaceae bacterium NBC_01309]